MLSSLFVNTTIIVSFILLAGQVFRNFHRNSKGLIFKIGPGILGGLLGIVLMLYSIKLHGETLVDFRYIPVVLLSHYTTPISTFLAALIIAAFRVLYFNLSDSSLLGSTAVILIAIGCSCIALKKLKDHLNYIYTYGYSLLIIDTMLIILLREEAKLVFLISEYTIIYMATGIIVFKLTEYTAQSNRLFRQFKEQANRDFLTGLNNVRHFDNLLKEAFNIVNERGGRLSILTIDIDYFKKVNDNYGHDGGDAVLKQLAELLQTTCRPFDVAARIGGEEFSVILLDCSLEQATEAAERIRGAVGLHDFILPCGKNIKISVSIGVATYPDSIRNVSELRKQADIELYKAKKTGRNKVCSRLTCT